MNKLWRHIFTEEELKKIKEVKDAWAPNRVRNGRISGCKKISEKCMLCEKYTLTTAGLCQKHYSQYIFWKSKNRKFKISKMMGEQKQFLEYEQWRRKNGYKA